MACVLVEMLIANEPDEARELVEALPTSGAQENLLEAALFLCAEVLHDVNSDDAKALKALHRIRRESHGRSLE